MKNTTSKLNTANVGNPVIVTCEIVCNIYCAIDIVLMIVGVIANGIVVWRVVRDKDLRKPTFTAIAGLAVADIGFLIAYFAVNQIDCPTDIPAYETSDALMLAVYMSMWFISATHIPLLSIIRFIAILRPLTFSTSVTVRRTIAMSVGIWIAGLILGIIAGILFALKQLAIVDNDSVITMFVVVTLGSYFIPLIVAICFHSIKLREVCKALKSDLPEQVRHMSLMVTITLLLFTLLPLPQVVSLFIICFSDDLGFLEDTSPGVNWSLSLGLLLNSCVNPFIYAIFSRLFRESLRKPFCQTSNRRNLTQYGSNGGFPMDNSSYH